MEGEGNGDEEVQPWYTRPAVWGIVVGSLIVFGLAVWLTVYLTRRFGTEGKKEKVRQKLMETARIKSLVNEPGMTTEKLAKRLGLPTNADERTPEQNARITALLGYALDYRGEEKTLGRDFAYSPLGDLEREKSRSQENLQKYQTLFKRDPRVVYNPIFMYETPEEAHSRCFYEGQLPKLKDYDPRPVPLRDPPSVRVGPHYMLREVYDNWDQLSNDAKEQYLCRLWRANTRVNYIDQKTEGVLNFYPPPAKPEQVPDKIIVADKIGTRRAIAAGEEQTKKFIEERKRERDSQLSNTSEQLVSQAETPTILDDPKVIERIKKRKQKSSSLDFSQLPWPFN